MRTTLRIPIFELRRRKATHLLPSVLAKIVSGGSKEASTAAVLTSGTEKPMEILEPTHTEAVPWPF